jgi:hypothetical protein
MILQKAQSPMQVLGHKVENANHQMHREASEGNGA